MIEVLPPLANNRKVMDAMEVSKLATAWSESREEQSAGSQQVVSHFRPRRKNLREIRARGPLS